MHIGFGNVLDDDRNVKVPSPYCFVVRCCNEPPILVDECNSVDRPKMLVVFLGDISRVHVILENDKSSDDNSDRSTLPG